MPWNTGPASRGIAARHAVESAIRSYIGKGLRADLARLDEGAVPRLIESLKRRGVAESVIRQALAETGQAS